MVSVWPVHGRLQAKRKGLRLTGNTKIYPKSSYVQRISTISVAKPLNIPWRYTNLLTYLLTYFDFAVVKISESF